MIGIAQRQHERRLFLGLLVIHVSVLVAAYVFAGPSLFVLGSDGQDYLELGNNLLFGDGFGRIIRGQFIFADDRTPLYPLLVAGSAYIGGSSTTLLLALFQAIIAALTGVIAFRLARRVLPVVWSGAMVLLFALEPVTAGLHMLSYAETLLTLFVLLAIEYVVRAFETGKLSYAVVSAVALSCASYTKPVAVYFGFALVGVAMLCARRERRSIGLVIALLFVALLSPWVIRNTLRTGQMTFTTYGTKAFCGYELSAFYAARDHFPDATPEYAIGKMLYDDAYRPMYDRCLAQGSVLKEALRLMYDSPRAFVKANTVVAFAFFTNDGLGQFFEKSSQDALRHNTHLSGVVLLGAEWKAQVRDAFVQLAPWQQIALVVFRLFWIVVFLCAVSGCIVLLRDEHFRHLAIALALSICYFAGVTILAAGLGAGARYRYVIDYQLIILGVVWLRYISLRIPQTRAKLLIARVLSWGARKARGASNAIVERNGITYDLDLTEGIDLSIYLFAHFQKQVTHSKLIQLAQDDVVVDVGANVGAMSLQFAAQTPKGRVYACEPTTYGQEKMKKNLALNPSLQQRITTIQAFVGATSRAQPEMTAYASWKVAGKGGEHVHHVHGGEAKAAPGVPSLTLDDIVREQNITRLNVIKIDTDGYEWEVLQGAEKTLQTFRPVIIFEIGQYTLSEHHVNFEHIARYFERLGYGLYTSNDGDCVTMKNWKWHIPKYGTIDLVAQPQTKK